MTDDHSRDLGDRLRDLVPDPPAAPGRAAAAVERSRRHRRARTTAAVVGAAAAVAVVVGAVAVLPGDEVADPVAPATPQPTRSAGPTEPATDVECPDTTRGGRQLPNLSTSPLPSNPVAVRLCPISRSELNGFPASIDALEDGAEEFVAALQEKPVVEPDAERVCSADLAATYAFAIGYADGTRRIVTEEQFGCRDLEGAGPLRTSGGMTAAFVEALHDQREAQQPPGPAGLAPSCPVTYPAPGTPTYQLGETTAAVLCVRDPDQEGPAPWREVAVPADDLAVLVNDLTDGRYERRFPPTCPSPQLALVGVTAWGDLGTTQQNCGVWALERGVHRSGRAAQAVVDRLVAQAPSSPAPEPTSRMAPDEALNAVVDLVNDGRLDVAGDHTSAPELLDAGGRIDVKTGSWRTVPTPRSVSAPTRLADVELIYRVGDGEYRDAVARMSRLPGQPWYVFGIELGDVVPTGD
ncbi:hypothetical protein GCM10023340_01280 [Nocardioides marinquilinus]|uniref:Serine/threonine protein kinase n=1 Tax=Nocardioides marinquilinus TaxID=1210400 RepID=A0ABP9P6F9_9ACTN